MCAGLLLTLIAAITTVILAIAHIRPENTLVVLTLEVTLLTVDNTAGARLVTLILTVGSAVTVPAFRHADTARLTLELLLRVALVGSNDRTAQLVTTVVTVRYTIALI
jgi:hypothetical protein